MSEYEAIQILDDYQIEPQKRTAATGDLSQEGHSVVFIDIKSSLWSELDMSIQFIDDKLYCIYFMNNQFFERSDEDMRNSLIDILEGRYSVQGKENSLHIVTDSGVHPEYIEESNSMIDSYEQLPMTLSKT